jgi:hypothetical protein
VLTDGVFHVYVIRKQDSNFLIHKHLSHLRRLFLYLSNKLELPDVPPLPAAEGEANAAGLITAFCCFVGNLGLDSNSEIQHFFNSSLPLPGVWGELEDGGKSAPKVRRVVVDVQVCRAIQLVSQRSFFGGKVENAAYYAVVSASSTLQRYVTRAVVNEGAEAQWGDDVCLTVSSSAGWFCVSVFAADSSSLVGMVRIPVFPYMKKTLEEETETEFDLIDVRHGNNPVSGKICLKIAASHLAVHHDRRGLPVRELPIRLDTGDMIFFKMNKLTSMLNRLVTWSNYDHVGIVIGGKKLKFLEAVSDSGVMVLDLEKCLSLYKVSSSEIAVLRLNILRTKEMNASAAEFAKEVHGLPYNWNVVDMVTTTTDKSASSSKAMFCSQLVASVLQKLGVLPEEVIPDNYLPGTLSSPDLKLQSHVEADPLVSFTLWDGDAKAVEHPYVQIAEETRAEMFKFGKHYGTLNASWKQEKKDTLVTIVGTTEDGFFVLENGSTVPSAFVD